MANDQKKLMRRFTILWFVSLAFILVVLFLAIKDSKESIHRYIDQQVQAVALTAPEPLPGKDGKDGITTTIQEQRFVHETITLPGPAGLAGQNGLNGKDGEDGQDGADGRKLILQVNPLTGNLETQYEGDTVWQVLIPCVQLLTKCEVDE